MCQRMANTREQAVAKGGQKAGENYDKISAMNPTDRTNHVMTRAFRVLKSPNRRRVG